MVGFLFFIVFRWLPRPPRCTLFPYTTLFRSVHARTVGRCADREAADADAEAARRPGHPPASRQRRSEEHTSELQSLTNLVCRLLLEKKNLTLADDRRVELSDSAHARQDELRP